MKSSSEEESLEEEAAETDGAKVPKIAFRDYAPSDPVYSEGPQSYSPHWTRGLKPIPATKPPAGDRKATERDDDVSGKDHC